MRVSVILVLHALTAAADEPPKGVEKPPEGAFATVNGARLWYHSEGDGVPLIIIPGGPGLSHRYLYPHFSTLKDAHQVVYFDPFGRGRSDRATKPEEYTIDRDVEDVEGLRKALGFKKARILGYSYGGMVAQAYALKYPDTLDRLVLVVAPHSAEMMVESNAASNRFQRNLYPEIWEKADAWVRRGGTSSDPEYQRLFERVHPGLFTFFNPKAAENKAFTDALAEFNPDVFHALCGKDGDTVLGGDVAKFDRREELRDIAAPTLVVGGRCDQLCPPRWMFRYKEYMPDARIEIIENAGHFPQLEEPEKLSAVLRGFLK